MADDASKPVRRRRAKAPTTADPIEIAMEAGEGDGPARKLLVRQERLVGWQIANERAGFVLKCLLGAAGAGLAAGLGAMAIAAANDHSLVIEAFETPPDLAARGLSGKVLATQLQDRLSQMQSETVTADQARSVSNRWSGEIKVIIPQTGVSLGEVRQLLNDWLGHATRVSGEVVRTAPGELAITVRAGAAPGVRRAGPEAGIDALVQAAAEGVYGATQPNRYGAWLDQHGRRDEAIAVWQAASKAGERPERAASMVRLAGVYNAMGRATDEEINLMRQARRLAPESSQIAMALSSVENNLGHAESALALSLEAERKLRREPGFSEGGRRFSYYANVSNRQLWFGAYLDSVASAERQAEETRVEDQVVGNRMIDAWALALAHDVTGSRRIQASVAPGEGASEEEKLAFQRVSGRAVGQQAMEMEDWPAVVALTDQFPSNGRLRPIIRIARANALAMLGRIPEAETVIGETPTDCYPCVVARGRIAALKHDWAGAERWFAEADRQAPSYPQAPTERGRMLLMKGDAKGAAAALSLAAKRSPNYADAQELWGEALMATGDPAAAASKFALAARSAPRWALLHIRWGEALAKLGKAAEARAKFAAAAEMDLSPSARAALAKAQGAR